VCIAKTGDDRNAAFETQCDDLIGIRSALAGGDQGHREVVIVISKGVHDVH